MQLLNYLLLLLLFLLACQPASDPGLDFLLTPHEEDETRNTTASHAQAVDFYEQLAAAYPSRFSLQEAGMTDSGFPLLYGTLSNEGILSAAEARAAEKIVLFVNNAIHAGEPCGVDATMRLVRDYLQLPEDYPFPDEVVLVFIPMYSIGGVLNRGRDSRANQNGPAEHGFRGNARNLDLNRDFIKCDSRNARSFNRLFSDWQPEVFIDNHTSNGADYQYTLTLIATQHNKLSAPLANYLKADMLPHFYQDLPVRGWDLTPYVYVQTTPDDGIYGFLDLPRYSSGYAALHHSIGFMPETHMFKPFKDRSESVYQFMQSTVNLVARDREKIQAVREEAIAQDRAADSLALNWVSDSRRSDTIQFKGYEAKQKPSEITGQDRLYYDRNAPYTKPIPLFDYYQATTMVDRPLAYVIPYAWGEVIERLENNGVIMEELVSDTTLEVQQYYIDNYESRSRPYEGHYLHYNVQVRTVTREVTYRAGDYLVYTDQPAVRYIVETLEPQAPDSYFAWNFFDGILQQKEYFSSYVFEDIALDLLNSDPEMAAELAAAKAADPELAANAYEQLLFIYRRSEYYEPTHNLYPVGRVINSLRSL